MDSSRRQAMLATALLVLPVLAGCGHTTKTVTVGNPPAPASPAGATTTTNATAKPTGPVVHLSAFRSPTGNIGCVLAGGQARCDIERRSWSPPSRPTSCPTMVDFGQGLEMQATGAPRFVCAGDTVRDPKSPVLAYGTTSMSGAFECVSASNGVTCTRPADGHGFFLSIQTYRLF